MSNEQWVLLTPPLEPAEAEILQGLLEAQGFTVYLAREGAGRALGLTVGPLGQAQLYVPASQKEAAEQVYHDFLRGTFAAQRDEEASPGE
ncbi:MAG TPA: DUF2007 domain-containing protein [Anaerolineae bacterium]|nr:DUF2007 domain-containing protein [Anaerolineae bacterium]HID84438.1 hypothetical protein [Anaerolineales bacterium]HIQ09281.1 hypothetical protein [Anaerolineaceae bacterium]